MLKLLVNTSLKKTKISLIRKCKRGSRFHFYQHYNFTWRCSLWFRRCWVLDWKWTSLDLFWIRFNWTGFQPIAVGFQLIIVGFSQLPLAKSNGLRTTPFLRALAQLDFFWKNIIKYSLISLSDLGSYGVWTTKNRAPYLNEKEYIHALISLLKKQC